jgi:TolB-like protein/DNA-binding winged helix-turn-helix (wHTH) protein/tetratricopeptide (TPR) repeat protein
LPAGNQTTVQFGAFEMNVETAELRKSGFTVKLSPQPSKVLLFLVKRAGSLATREEIKKEVWGAETFVDFEQGLNFCIRQIRSALLDDADKPRYIETVPKRGYRFIAPIQYAEAQTSFPLSIPMRTADVSRPIKLQPIDRITGAESKHDLISGLLEKIAARQAVDALSSYPYWRPRRKVFLGAGLILLLFSAVYVWSRTWPKTNPQTQLATALARKQMLAVLPFENLSGDSEQEFLTDGITEEMIAQLGRLNPRRLGVIARTSAMGYKTTHKSVPEIAKELSVDYLLEGTVRRSGRQARITARLIQVSDQTNLWAQSYDVETGSGKLISVQHDIAKRISNSLLHELLPSSNSSPTDLLPEAHEAYLKGRFLEEQRTEHSVRKAIEYFQRAISLQADYASAYSGLADCYMLLPLYDPTTSAVPYRANAFEAAKKAVDLDGNNAEAHLSLGQANFRAGNFAVAEPEYKKAMELDPNSANAHHWYGLFLATQGRLSEAREHLAQARELDPVSLIIATNSGWMEYFSGNIEGAIAQYRKVLDLDPQFGSARSKLISAFEQKGMWKQAAELQRQRFAGMQNTKVDLALADVNDRKSYYRGLELVLEEILTDPRRRITDYEVAAIYSMAGERTKAIEWLNTAYQNQSGTIYALAEDPAFLPLCSEPEFQSLLTEMGFSAEALKRLRSEYARRIRFHSIAFAGD